MDGKSFHLRADAAITVHQTRLLTKLTHTLAPSYIPSCNWPAPDLLASFAFMFACIRGTAHAVAASTVLDRIDVPISALRNACAELFSCSCACKVMPMRTHRWCRSSTMCGEMNQIDHQTMCFYIHLFSPDSTDFMLVRQIANRAQCIHFGVLASVISLVKITPGSLRSTNRR